MNDVNSSEPPEGTVPQPQDTVNTPIAVRITSSKTWTNPRKRPHHQDSTSLFEPVSADDALREEGNGKDLHSSKRSRAAEWPLKNTDDPVDTRKHDGEGDKRSSSTSIRAGKFLEGSMNDKVSQKPPSLYTKDEQAMEEYARMQGNGRGQMDMDIDMTYDAGIESYKPSGMFRFGKAIANAFKPFTAWQGVFREKEKERSTSPEKNILQDRQARAAEAYSELKKSGYKGTQTRRGIQEPPALKHEEVEKQAASFRDSGIDMNGEQASAWTPNDQLVGSNNARLVPPPPPNAYAGSQHSDTSSARKTTHQLRKSSLQGLKKVASQIHLSPVKKTTEKPPVPSIEIDHAPDATVLSPPAGLGLRREPSKKDIAKQYRLSKKVSDLENKLETARRELELSMSTAPPVPDLPTHLGRKPFTPGALPSLHSEGNMTPLKSTTAPPVPKMKGEQIGGTLQDLPLQRNSARIASEPGVFAPMTGTGEIWNLKVGKGSAETARPRTSRGIKAQTRSALIASESHSFTPIGKSDAQNMEPRKGNLEMERPRTSRGMKAQTSTGLHKRLPEVPSKIPHNSPVTFAESMSPIPTTAQNSSPSNDNAVTPIASTVTDHMSVVHTDSPPHPFVGPSATAPTRTRSKGSKHGISPPPPSLASAKKADVAYELTATPTESAAKLASVESKVLPKTKRGISPPPPSLASTKKVRILSDETATPVAGMGSTEAIDDDLGPLQSVSPQKLNGDPVKKSVGMKAYTLPATRKEDFEWPDDVF